MEAGCLHGIYGGGCVTCTAYNEHRVLTNEHEELYAPRPKVGSERAHIDAEHHPAFWRGPDPRAVKVGASRWGHTSTTVERFRRAERTVEGYRAEHGHRLRRRGTISNERTVHPSLTAPKPPKSESDQDFDRVYGEASARVQALAAKLGVEL
jgi:hypothetical protein